MSHDRAIDILAQERVRCIKAAEHHEEQARCERLAATNLDAAIAMLVVAPASPNAEPLPAPRPKDEPSPRVRLARECAELETDLNAAQKAEARGQAGVGPGSVTGAWSLADLEGYHRALVAMRDSGRREPGEEG